MSNFAACEGRPTMRYLSRNSPSAWSPNYEVFVAKVPRLGLSGELQSLPTPPIRYLSRNYFPLFLNGLPDRRRAVRSFWPSFATNTSQRPLRGAIRLLGFRRIPERSPTFATNTLWFGGSTIRFLSRNSPAPLLRPSPGMRYLSRNSPNPTFATNTL